MNQIPSQVWIGPAAELQLQVTKFLQNQFCINGACGHCAVCRQIVANEFPQILWLEPDGQYKVEQIREVLSRLSLRLGSDEKFYIVFSAAHCLNTSSANSLLKVIEEPPMGYNFIFLVARKELVLPTILSRSQIKNFYNGGEVAKHPLFSLFTGDKVLTNPVEFIALIDQQKDLNDQLSCELLDQIYGYWLAKLHKSYLVDPAERSFIQTRVDCLQNQLNYPPMSGSSKLFWKNLYMQFYGN